MKFLWFALCFGVFKCSGGNEIVQEVINELQSDSEIISTGVKTIVKEVDDAVVEYRKKKENLFGGPQSDDFNVLQMYEWYEKEGNKAPKRCLSVQRTLQMIRSGYNENVNQCLKRVDLIVVKLEEKSKALDKMAGKHGNIVDLVGPCEQLDVPDECLAQAKQQAKIKTDSMVAALQRFEIFKKLKMYEIDTTFDVCHSIAETYKNSEREEIAILRKCMSGDDDYQDKYKIKLKN